MTVLLRIVSKRETGLLSREDNARGRSAEVGNPRGKARSTKFGIRNEFKAPNSNEQNRALVSNIGTFVFRARIGFRASNFVFTQRLAASPQVVRPCNSTTIASADSPDP